MSTIAQHADIFRAPFRQFHENKWLGRQGTSPPDMRSATGTVQAYINHGRGVADCPSGCGNAIAVSIAEPYFLCTVCGQRTNNGQWYHVAFPANRAAIESLLVRRQSTRPVPPNQPYFVNTRNWTVGESVESLGRENRGRGVR